MWNREEDGMGGLRREDGVYTVEYQRDLVCRRKLRKLRMLAVRV
jgi:hypothetical protein